MVLKELSNEIAPILQIIFQIIPLTTGEVPDDWKEDNVAPIFKKGDKRKPTNYRPVSLTCITSKIMEHIIVSNLIKHLEIQKILSPLQHVFGEITASFPLAESNVQQYSLTQLGRLDRSVLSVPLSGNRISRHCRCLNVITPTTLSI